MDPRFWYVLLGFCLGALSATCVIALATMLEGRPLWKRDV